MEKQVIYTPHAPGAVGPYSQGIRAGNLVFTAGQIALDPATGKLVEGDVATQTERVLKNLKAVLEAAGTSLENAVKTTVYLKDMADFAAMNGVYKGYFGDNPPARTTFQAGALPLGGLVEIEVVAIVP